ncbi:MAG: DUF1622 domain-containing protein [Nitrospirae bacterium]|nr:DUF1622 domain-containing protein [Nitrospirota bacterium]
MLQIHELMELAAMGVEILAVVLMVCFILYGTMRWVLHSATKIEGAYDRYRVMLGKSLLIGLELMVAADIIRTVLDTTPQGLALLGGLVVVRTALGWTLTVDIEGRWPWQGAKESGQGAEGGSTQKNVS